MRFRLPRVRLTRRRITVGLVTLTLLGGVITWAAWPAPRNYTTHQAMLTVDTGPTGAIPIRLDTTFYLPNSASSTHPVPAILLAHGFGGTKNSVASDAQDFANAGYAVLAWTAEGFGRSGGQIHLDSPDWEVRDAQHLLDWLASQPDVLKDGPGDPRVGVVGGSYGGGLALMLAGYDHRVDAIAPSITWNDLARSFLPDSTGGSPVDGVFKKQWAGIFFGSGAGLPATALGGAGAPGGPSGSGTSGSGNTPGAGSGATPGPSASPGVAGTPTPGSSNASDTTGTGTAPGTLPPGPAGSGDPTCGRFARDICQAYLQIATAGRATPQAVALLRRSSPASILNRIKAPTLLIQGQDDSLFPLSEADANARGIAANGTPVHVDWFTGGHDGGTGPQSDVDRLRYLTITWMDHYLRGNPKTITSGFTYSRVTGIDASSEQLHTETYSAPAYPGLTGNEKSLTVGVAGPPQQVVNPPNGTPAAITSLPGAGSLSSFASGVTTEVPGQHADFYSEPLSSPVDVVGAPTVSIRAGSPTGEAVLFVKLYDVDSKGSYSLPDGLIAPIRLTNLPARADQAKPVTVTLPAIVHRFEAGHRLLISVATSDQAYATPPAPTVYTVALSPNGGAITLPQVAATPVASPEVVWRYVLAAALAAVVLGLLVLLIVARIRRRRATVAVDPEYADVPLVVRDLRKEYADGFVAVSKVDFAVRRGQVVGLLGPNGAGKTTTLRVLMGLTRPNRGEVLVFGHHLEPGADVLTRLGALVEGPGFLPHLTGLQNLRLYWRATGRPEAEARLDEALDIAGLGDAVYRKVRTYSHGMRQRLAIAQAMLGLPELLVLDEPTDGLDPPQIAEMRRVLRAYATDGRAVLVSSHLLAEVEQTCTHVVVMHKGEVVASGEVDDVVGDSPITQFEVSNVDAAELVLDGLAGVRSVAWDGRQGLIVDLDGAPRSEVVAALVKAGVGVDRVAPRRRLEDAFLALVGGDTKAGGER